MATNARAVPVSPVCRGLKHRPGRVNPVLRTPLRGFGPLPPPGQGRVPRRPQRPAPAAARPRPLADLRD